VRRVGSEAHRGLVFSADFLRLAGLKYIAL